MNQEALARIGIGFVVLWMAIGLVSWLHIRAQKSPAEKKRWFDRYAWLMGALVAATGGALLLSQGNLIAAPVVLIIVGAMVFLRVRSSYFCGACGKFSSCRNWFAKEYRCPHCNNRLR